MKIRKQEWVEVEIVATLPYYYHQNLSSEHGHSDIYGKIEEQKCTTIHLSEDYDGDKTIELSISKHKSIDKTGLGCYFTKEFESSESMFNEMMEIAKKFVSSL